MQEDEHPNSANDCKITTKDDEVTLAESNNDTDDDATIHEIPANSPPLLQSPLYNDKANEILKDKIIAVNKARREAQSASVFSKVAKAAAWAFTPSPSKHSRSLLCFACSALNVNRVAELIDTGVPINADANFGHGPLMAVIRSQPPRLGPQGAMIDFLISEGADVNYTGADEITPLSAAVDAGHTQLVDKLLDYGADINDRCTMSTTWKDFIGVDMSALHVAVSKGRSDCLQLLVARGADYSSTFRLSNDWKPCYPVTKHYPTEKTTWVSKVTPLHIAVNDVDCVKCLLKLGADPRMKDSRGRTPFHWAVEAANSDVVVVFLSQGYPVDDPGEEGVTALGMICAALERGAKEEKMPLLTQELLRAGASLDVVYPQDLTIRERWLLMEDWRGTYDPIFKQFGGKV